VASETEVVCPYCGGSFPPGRLSCPHCGSDRETGWRPPDEIETAALDLPATSLDDEEYQEVLANEGLASGRGRSGGGLRILALMAGLAFLLFALRQCWK